MRTRRGPSAVARCAVVATAALVGAAVPAGARADGFDPVAGLADQIQAATWSQVSGAAAAQPPAEDMAQKITDATRAAVAGVVTEAAGTGGRGDSPTEAPRASAPHVTRARAHEKARPRPAAAAASPILPARPPAQIEVQRPPKDEADRREERRPEPAGAAPSPRSPTIPFDAPSIPLPFAMPSSAGAASSGGSPVPPLLVALAATLGWFASEVVLRRVPPRRPVRPRRIVLPTWRPG